MLSRQALEEIHIGTVSLVSLIHVAITLHNTNWRQSWPSYTFFLVLNGLLNFKSDVTFWNCMGKESLGMWFTRHIQRKYNSLIPGYCVGNGISPVDLNVQRQ